MNDDRRTPMHADDLSIVLDNCALDAHRECSVQDCQVRRISELLAEISTGQVRVAILTTVIGLLTSTTFALCLVAIWAWHAYHGNAMPDVPWFIISIALVPFTAGAAMMIRIPAKAKWRITKIDS